MELTLLVLGIVVIGYGVWVLDCNTKTNLQLLVCLSNLLKALTEGRISQDEFAAYLSELDTVPYNSHLMRLATFRDPMVLYSKGLTKFF